MPPPLTIEQLADSLRVNFVGHAAEIPANDWRERWVWLNRASAIMVGVGLGLKIAGESRAAEELTFGLLAMVRDELPNTKEMATFTEGLEVRILKCYLALAGKPDAADLLTPKQLRSLCAEHERQRQKGAA